MIFELVAEDRSEFLTGDKDSNRIRSIRKSNERLLRLADQANGKQRRVVPADVSLANDLELVHGGERMNQKRGQVKLEFVIEREFSFGGTEL